MLFHPGAVILSLAGVETGIEDEEYADQRESTGKKEPFEGDVEAVETGLNGGNHPPDGKGDPCGDQDPATDIGPTDGDQAESDGRGGNAEVEETSNYRVRPNPRRRLPPNPNRARSY